MSNYVINNLNSERQSGTGRSFVQNIAIGDFFHYNIIILANKFIYVKYLQEKY